MAETPLAQSLIFITAAVIAVAPFSLLRMPAAPGYLLAGLIIGPHGLGLVEVGEETHFLAELGLIFLLFMVGLEFSIPKIVAARRDVLLGGSLQFGLMLTVVAMALAATGEPIRAAIVIGAAVAMSSLAITLKQLAEQGELSSRHAQLALGILLFQDLAALPMLILVDSWSIGGQPEPLDILRQMAVAIIVLAAAGLAARPLIHAGFAGVLKTRSPDLFLLWVLLVALGTAYLVTVAGLSAPVGAFIAGVVIGESEFRLRVEEDIRPFRDALVGLFFVTVGMEIDPSIIASFPGASAIWLLVFLAVKPLVAFPVGLIVTRSRHVAARTAVILSHGGEFGLMLITLALSGGIIPPNTGQPVLAALAVTMGIAPLIIQRNHWAERLFGRFDRRMEATEAAIRAEASELQDHVILCGCGRVGRVVATVLEAAEIDYIAIEHDLARFRAAQRQGHNVVFGDASHSRILDAAGIRHAQLLVLTFDNHRAVERILHHARQRATALASLISTADDREVVRFAELGATAVFPENLAAGLGLADQALLLCGKTQEEAARIVTSVRAELNPEIEEMVGI